MYTISFIFIQKYTTITVRTRKSFFRVHHTMRVKIIHYKSFFLNPFITHVHSLSSYFNKSYNIGQKKVLLVSRSLLSNDWWWWWCRKMFTLRSITIFICYVREGERCSIWTVVSNFTCLNKNLGGTCSFQCTGLNF